MMWWQWLALGYIAGGTMATALVWITGGLNDKQEEAPGDSRDMKGE